MSLLSDSIICTVVVVVYRLESVGMSRVVKTDEVWRFDHTRSERDVVGIH